MSAAQLLEINRQLRVGGSTVHEWAGCMTRGNGQSWAGLRGGIVHHTGSPHGAGYRTLFDGRTDLAGPLCNWSGNSDGSFTFMALYPANHAGASGGRSMGPLPVTKLFNPITVGLEIVYPGVQPMTDAQYWAACRWARVVADVVGGGNIEVVRGHAETSITGKWDPGKGPDQTIDLRQFRADAARTLDTNMAAVDWDIQYTFGRTGLRTQFGNWIGETNANTAAAVVGLNNVHAKLDALGVAVAQIRSKVQSFDTDNDGLVSTESAAVQGDWAAVVAAAERGAREGATAEVLARIDAMEAALNADDAEQAKAGALSALSQLRAVLPAS